MVVDFFVHKIIGLDGEMLRDAFDGLDLAFRVVHDVIEDVSAKFAVIADEMAMEATLGYAIKQFRCIDADCRPLHIVGLEFRLDTRCFDQARIRFL